MVTGVLLAGAGGSEKEIASVVLGAMSMVSWAVAEIPQIITNYKCKSTSGLSLAFLLTWIAGDFLNVLGCLLEPITLPTQLYMALMFSATTLLLTGQSLYYGYFYHRSERDKFIYEGFRDNLDRNNRNEKQVDQRKQPMPVGRRASAYTFNQAGDRQSSSVPIPCTFLTQYGSAGGELYYMSARSLSSSPKTSLSPFMSRLGDQGRTSSAISDENPSSEPLLGSSLPAESTPPVKTKNVLCVVFSSLFVLANCGLHLSSRNMDRPRGIVIPLGRNLLQVNSIEALLEHSGGNSSAGTFLGWAMAAVYMGGRLPQICLNIRRGNVDGLSPFMFFFALLGNGTYIASILVRSLEWSKIRPNLPWLVDAGGCVLLDIFIVLQFIYYKYNKEKGSRSSRTHNNLV